MFKEGVEMFIPDTPFLIGRMWWRLNTSVKP